MPLTNFNKLGLVVLGVILLVFFASCFFGEEEKADIKINQSTPIIGVKKNEIEKTNRPEEVKESVAREKLEIIFLGDLMFDRYIREISTQKGNDYILAGLKDHLKEADLVVANLEGPITDNQSKSLGTEIGRIGHLIFTFDPAWAQTLSDCNIKLVSLDNNHILNFGADGLVSTKQYLEKSQVNYFGLEEQPTSQAWVIGDNQVFFVSFNQFRKSSYDQTLKEIKKIKNQNLNNRVIVYCHWGEEYQATANDNQQQLAHEFIESGADLIVGAHPHVVQNSEIYLGKRVYYSLGNAVFDQYFSSETMKGKMLKVIIGNNNQPWEFQEEKVVLKNNGQTELKK